ncbi:MAG: protein DA1, partial [Deltaproteobacteria bacterium]
IMKSRNTVLSMLHSIGISDIPATIPINIVDMVNLKKYSKEEPNSNSKGFTTCLTTYKNNQAISKSQAIYILNGLPLLEFNGVLAHEMMHVWLHERDIKLTEPETEGFCNLGAMKVYQDDGSEFAKILLKNMEKNQDPIYGDGYQNMKKQLEKLGWEKLIRMIQNR